MSSQKGFTLIEMMIVIMIAGILAAAAIPIMRGRIDAAKWAEAKATAGAIKRSARAYIVSKGPEATDFSEIEGSLGDGLIASRLGFTDTSLDGSYFNQPDYSISDVRGSGSSVVGAGSGTSVVTATSSHPEGPPGTGVLASDGTWSVTTDGGTGGGGGKGGGKYGDGGQGIGGGKAGDGSGTQGGGKSGGGKDKDKGKDKGKDGGDKEGDDD